MDINRKCIDSLKGIGILGIILVHCNNVIYNSAMDNVVMHGARGVQLLFIINAFLIFNSLSKIEFTRHNIIEWWKRKFLRILPLYYLFTIIWLIVFGTGHNYWLGPLEKISWLNILCNFLLIHGFFPYYVNSINANWFMGVLAVFYLLAPFMYKLINSFEKSVAALMIVTPLGFLLRHLLLDKPVLQDVTIWNDYVNLASFISELPIILMGIVAYYLVRHIKDKSEKIKYPREMSYVCLLFAAFALYALLTGRDYFLICNKIYTFAAIFTIIFVSQMVYPVKIMCNRVFEVIGKHSYGIYLSHLIILKYVDIAMKNCTNSIVIVLIRCILVLTVSLLVAILAEKLIENPIRKRLSQNKEKLNYGK